MSSFSFRYAGHIDVTQHAKTPLERASTWGKASSKVAESVVLNCSQTCIRLGLIKIGVGGHLF
jgi:hypothetical protein